MKYKVIKADDPYGHSSSCSFFTTGSQVPLHKFVTPSVCSDLHVPRALATSTLIVILTGAWHEYLCFPLEMDYEFLSYESCGRSIISLQNEGSVLSMAGVLHMAASV